MLRIDSLHAEKKQSPSWLHLQSLGFHILMGVYLTKRGELLLANKQKRPSRSWVVVAEEVGFEPTVAIHQKNEISIWQNEREK
jgi:hypothetical protein